MGSDFSFVIKYNGHVKLKQMWKLLLITGTVGAVAGLLVFRFFPQKYIATGALLVSRRAQTPAAGVFSYEGYYAQQTARGYAETLIGMLESTDARRKALESLGITPNEADLRQAKRSVRVKKSAPQVVILEVRKYDPNKADDYWKALVSEVMDISGNFNARFGDPLISVNTVEGSPTVYPAYKNVFIDVLVGAGLGLVFGLFVIHAKEYLK
jgi:hypothetical protein